MWHSLGMIKTK